MIDDLICGAAVVGFGKTESLKHKAMSSAKGKVPLNAEIEPSSDLTEVSVRHHRNLASQRESTCAADDTAP